MENLRSSEIKGKVCVNVVKRDATVRDIKVTFCLQDLTVKHSHAPTVDSSSDVVGCSLLATVFPN